MVDAPHALRVAVTDSSADACVPAVGTCAHAPPLALADGECRSIPTEVLSFTDLRPG